MKQGNPWAIGGFISAISPNLIAFAYVLWHYVLQHVLQPGHKSDMDFFSGTPLGILMLPVMLFLGFLFFHRIWTMVLGIVSVALAIIALRKSELGARRLAVFALALGAIEILAAGRGLLAHVLR